MIQNVLKVLFLFFAIPALMVSCDGEDIAAIQNSASVFDLEQAKASVQQSNLRFMRFFKERDTVKLAALYTTNARLMIDQIPTIKGRDSILAYYCRLFSKNVKEFEIETENIWGDSSIVVEEGYYTLRGVKRKDLDKGKYIVLWKQESGNWKMHHEMLASDSHSGTLLSQPDTLGTTTKKDSVSKKKK